VVTVGEAAAALGEALTWLVSDLVDDEYDCLLAPARLTIGSSRAEVSEFVWFELEDHLGLDPARYDVDRGPARRMGCQLDGPWLSARIRRSARLLMGGQRAGQRQLHRKCLPLR
jgi:hypothetical protein